MTLPALPSVANHLWQSTLFAGAAGLITALLRNHRARTRHWVWAMASYKFLIPFSLIAALGQQVHWRKPQAIRDDSVGVVVDAISQPFTPATARVSAIPTTPSGTPLSGLAFGIWACGFLGICSAWCIRWRRLRASIRDAAP